MLKRPVFQRLVVVAVAAACCTGCTPEVHRYKRFPDFSHPGWAQQQRNDAVAHDPYPVDDAGPEIVGGRPREYQRPLNEVERARLTAPPPIALQQIAVPGLPAAPPPVVTPPVVTPPVVTPPVVTTPVVTTPVVTTPFAPPVVPAVPAAPIQVQPRSPY